MPTPREKLVALQGRALRISDAATNLVSWASRLLLYLDDPDLQVSAQQRDRLLTAYVALRNSVTGLAANLPADLATFQPDPSEYQGG